MYSKIYTGAISGIDSLIATVEVDVSTGMPTFEMVGLLNHEVREAKERVKVALKNTGIEIPPIRRHSCKDTAEQKNHGEHLSRRYEKGRCRIRLACGGRNAGFTGTPAGRTHTGYVDCRRAGTGWNREACERNPAYCAKGEAGRA